MGIVYLRDQAAPDATYSTVNRALTFAEMDGNFKLFLRNDVDDTLNANLSITGSLTLGTALSVGNGGTGATTLTANNVLLGNGTSALQTVAPGASGNILTSNGTTWVSSAPGASGATLSDDTSTNTTQYIGMARATTGAWTAAYVASTKLYFNPSTGTLNATIFNSLSDANVKHDIVSIQNASQTVAALNGVTFKWNDTNEPSAGVIAQEVEKVLPDLVDENEHGVKSVNYSGLIAYLIECNKELMRRIEVLESR